MLLSPGQFTHSARESRVAFADDDNDDDGDGESALVNRQAGETEGESELGGIASVQKQNEEANPESVAQLVQSIAVSVSHASFAFCSSRT